MTSEFVLLDRVVRRAPFGVRFWDAVLGIVVADGLTVTLYPAADPSRQFRARANHAGVYVVEDLPDLRVADESLPFVVEVRDDVRRFLPFSFQADLPEGRQFVLNCVSPPASPGVPLFSAANRQAPSGMAVLRADLWDAANQRPAAGVLAEVRASQLGSRVRGLSDDRGCLTIIFPYPEPVRFVLGSPATPSGQPLELQSWNIEIRAWYAAADSTAELPDLCAILRQPPATLWADVARTQPLTGATLRYGRDLVLRTFDFARHIALPELWIT
jgi:hypothetical protein